MDLIPDIINAINLLTLDKMFFIFSMGCLWVVSK